jgi:hypothetical protein
LDEECVWEVCWTEAGKAEKSARFDRLVLATGQFPSSLRDWQSPLPCSEFKGTVVNGRHVRKDNFQPGNRVAVLGFGKTALDSCSLAAERGCSVSLIFRHPRWTVPQYLLGIHCSRILYARYASIFLPCWVHTLPLERVVHSRWFGWLRWLVWSLISLTVALMCVIRAPWPWSDGGRGLRRICSMLPPLSVLPAQVGAVTPMSTPTFFRQVGLGILQPLQGNATSIVAGGVQLADGRLIKADVVVIAFGSDPIRFPMLPAELERKVLSDDGAYLYRHCLHPLVHPRSLAFGCTHHSFLHLTSCHVAALWCSAVWSGDLPLPPRNEMEAVRNAMRNYKRTKCFMQPHRANNINARAQNFSDALLAELELQPCRKSNWLAECAAPYTASDYRSVLDEYLTAAAARRAAKRTLHPRLDLIT